MLKELSGEALLFRFCLLVVALPPTSYLNAGLQERIEAVCSCMSCFMVFLQLLVRIRAFKYLNIMTLQRV